MRDALGGLPVADSETGGTPTGPLLPVLVALAGVAPRLRLGDAVGWEARWRARVREPLVYLLGPRGECRCRRG